MLKLIITLIATAALIITAAGSALAEDAADAEDAGNIELKETAVAQFPCRASESTYACTLRALREEVLGEKPAVLRFV